MRHARAKRFFASCSHLLGLLLHRSGFFNFDLCPEILPDIDILKLHYSMSDFRNPWMNTAQTLTVVCSRHTMNMPVIFRLFGAI